MTSIVKIGAIGTGTRYIATTILIFSAVALAIFSTIRPQEMFSGGDYALYIMHALNLSSFSSYADTNYIHNAANSIISPRAYPPGFPALLSLPIAIFGLNFTVLKAFMAAIFIIWLYLFNLLLRKRFSSNEADLAVIICAFSPAVFERRDAILSDVPFGLLCYLSLLIYLECQRHTELNVIKYAALTLSMVAAISVRSIGIVLPVAIVLASTIPGQRYRLYSILSSISSVLVAYLVYKIFGATGGTETYFSYFDRSFGSVTSRLLLDAKLIYWVFAEVFALSVTPVFNAIAALLICFAVIYGFSKAIGPWLRSLKSIHWPHFGKNRVGDSSYHFHKGSVSEFAIIDIFFSLYITAILLFPVHTELTRYFIPIIPLLFWYLFRCIEHINFKANRHSIFMVAVVLFPLYILFYSTNGAGVAAKTIEDPESVMLLDAIKREVSPSQIIIAENPRVVALFANRKAAIWPQHPQYEEFWSYADTIGASFILFDFEHEVDSPDHVTVNKIIVSSGPRLKPVYKIGSTTLFKIVATP